MTYKDLFDEAFGSFEKKSRMTDKEFADTVRGRKPSAGVMTVSGGNIRILRAGTHTSKKHRLINAAAGTAAVLALAAGSVFGISYLNKHGALVEGGGQTAGSLSSAVTNMSEQSTGTAIAYTMPAKIGEEFVPPSYGFTDPETLPDISTAYGRLVQFHDASVRLISAEYDGETLTARFAVLYRGDDYDSYSPEYVRLAVGYTITDGEVHNVTVDSKDERFTIEESPESDSFSHICTYSVPLELEPDKSYSVSIIYFNPNHEGSNGSSTQGIEADKQIYQFRYSDDKVFAFDRCSVTPLGYSLDGMTLDMKYMVGFKDKSVADEPDFGLVITTPEACVMDSEIIEKSEEGAHVHLRIMFISLTHDCSVTFNENGKEYTYTASRSDDVNYLQFEIGSPEENREGIYPAFCNTAQSAVCVTYYGGNENTFITPEKLTVTLDDGTELEGEYLTQHYTHSDYKISTNAMRYNIPTCDPAHINNIYLGNACIYESFVKEFTSDSLVTPIDQWVEFTDEKGGVKVHFKDYYFDKAVLKLHYDVIFPQGVPTLGANGRLRIIASVVAPDFYTGEGTTVTAQTADTLSFETSYLFDEPQNEVTIVFEDTTMTGEDKLPFRLKAGNEALLNETRCPEPYEYKVNIDGKDTAELTDIDLYPGAVFAKFRLYDAKDENTIMQLMGSDTRVLRRYGKAIKLKQSHIMVRDGYVTIMTPFEEVTAISHIDSVYINDCLVWDRSSPEGGIVGTTISIDR